MLPTNQPYPKRLQLVPVQDDLQSKHARDTRAWNCIHKFKHVWQMWRPMCRGSHETSEKEAGKEEHKG